MHTARLATALTAVALASTVAAQDVTAPRTAPPAPHLTIETFGPAGWRARLGPTNLATLLDSPRARGLWEPMSSQILDQLAAGRGGDDGERAALGARWADYGGAIRVVMRADEDGRMSWAARLAKTPGTDLEALAGDVRAALGAAGPSRDWERATIGDAELEVQHDGLRWISAPAIDDGGFTVLSSDGDDLATAMALGVALRAAPTTAPAPRPGSPALTVRYDLASFVAMAAAESRGDDAEMFAPLGLDGLRELRFALRAAGPQMEFAFDVETAGAPRGLIAGLMPPSSGVSRLATLLPASAPVWSVGRFDCRASFEAILAALETSMPDIRGDLRQTAGMDIGRDLLAHLTDEYVVVGSPLQELRSTAEATWLIAFRVRDDAAFRTALDALLAKTQGAVVPLATTDVDGAAVRTFGNFLLYDFSIGAGHGVFTLAGGKHGERDTIEFLRRAAATDLGAEAAAVDVGQLVPLAARHLPTGLQGLGQLDLDALLLSPTELWFWPIEEFAEIDADATFGFDSAEDAQAEVRALLLEHGLGRMHTASSYVDGCWSWRLFW